MFRQAGILGGQLVRRVVLISLIAIIGLVVASAVALQGAVQNVDRQLDDAGAAAVATFDGFLSEIQTTLAASSTALSNVDDDEALFRRMLDDQPAFFELMLVDPQGDILAQRRRVGVGSSTRLAEQPWLETVRAGDVYISPVDSEDYGVPFIKVAVPVTDEDNAFVATLVAEVDLTALWGTAIGLRAGETGHVYVTDEAGQVLVYRNLNLLEGAAVLPDLVGYSPQELASDEGLPIYIGLSGELVVASSVALETVPWFAVVEIPLGEAIGTVVQLVVLATAVVVAMGSLAVNVTTFTRQQIVAPLLELHDGVVLFGEGSLDQRVAIEGHEGNEIGSLAGTFNDMAGQLQETFKRLEESVQDARRAEEAIRLRNRELAALNDMAAVVSRSLDLDELLNGALDEVVELAQVDAAGVYLLDVERLTMNLVAHRGVSERYAEEVGSVPLDERTVEAMTAQGKLGRFIFSAEETVPNEAVLGPIESAMQREGLRLDSTARVLLQAREEVLGFMAVTSREPRQFSEAELRLLTSIGQQLAVAIQNARLYEQIQHHADELERRVAERTAELKAANEELEALSRVKDEFVANVSHELRTPISNLKLHHDLVASLPEKAELYLGTLQRETERLERIIEDLLRLSRLDQAQVELNLTQVDINTLVDQYVADRPLLAEGRGLTLVMDRQPDLPHVRADEGMLGQALSILLTNALNYTPSGGQVKVSTHLRQLEGEQWVGFSVSDSGPGIPPDEQEQLFQRFFRGKAGRTSGQPGTGLGLAIAREIVDRHKGRVEVQNEGVAGRGATFSVWLPANGAGS
jgi:signal transduction histidine kinase